MRPPVLVVGDVVTDVAARLRAPAAPGSDAPADVALGGGGAGANVAWWLARCGVPVTLAARVGDDAPGRERAAELAAAGVHLHLARDAGLPTGTIVVLVDPAGERTMLTDRGANGALAAADLPAELFAAAGHLHLSGYPLLDASSRPAALEALAQAARAGLSVSVDPASAAPLARAGAQQFLEWTVGTNLLLPNLAEARLLSGAHDPQACARALGRRHGEAVVKLGAAGALWSDGERTLHVAAAGTTVVDTTGAGDAFTAGFLAARLDAADPRAALERGAELAARAVATHGARAGIAPLTP